MAGRDLNKNNTKSTKTLFGGGGLEGCVYCPRIFAFCGVSWNPTPSKCKGTIVWTPELHWTTENELTHNKCELCWFLVTRSSWLFAFLLITKWSNIDWLKLHLPPVSSWTQNTVTEWIVRFLRMQDVPFSVLISAVDYAHWGSFCYSSSSRRLLR